MYKQFLKRSFDLLIAFLLLITLLPLVILIFLISLAVIRSNPFFVQPRPGLGGNVFNLIKFKTMNDKKDAEGRLLPDSQRLTPFGRFLRSVSMDELPQLINVLKGDMSLVGPRPLLVKYLPLYTPEQARRHEVRPGITGWTQVSGRNSLSWEEKFKLDVWYVDHLSFALDIKILWLTLIKVLKREGINQAGQATMEAFKGNLER